VKKKNNETRVFSYEKRAQSLPHAAKEVCRKKKRGPRDRGTESKVATKRSGSRGGCYWREKNGTTSFGGGKGIVRWEHTGVNKKIGTEPKGASGTKRKIVQ